MLRNRVTSSITLTADHRERLKRLSAQTGTPMARIIGRLLDKHLANEERHAAALDAPAKDR